MFSQIKYIKNIDVGLRNSVDHLRILLIDFKECLLGHPNFDTKFIDFFVSNVNNYICHNIY